MPKQFDLIAFDWDGTLFDSTAIIVTSIQNAVKDLGYKVPSDEAAAYVIGLGLTQALAHAAPDVPQEKWPELGQRYRHHYALHVDDIVLFKGAEDLVRELRARGHQLAVATGKSRSGLDEAFVATGLGEVFHSSRTADETRGKPHPQMLLELMDELGVEPQRTLMIGDTTHDLQLAANAGCASVAVSFGAHESVALQALSPKFIAHNVAELRNWLLDHA
jgi:phosphoglycolate phosphatase